ncbi:glycosyltransferase 61 family protein [Phaeobacter sp. JH20_02]|uniref:glycosyltransferase family 61 protein n=1 Tax=unclassified Phaeobacter TaxID=2621772 RepID=UPI003A87DB3E
MPGVFSRSTDQIIELKNPLLVPWTDATRSERSATVFGADGTLCSEAVSWKEPGEARSALPDVLPDPATHLAGRYLFGGILQPHFGHTLAESTGRLWALDQAGDIDGILFFARDVKAARPRLINPAKAVLETFTQGRRVEIVTEPATVDQLVIPEQGFGLKDMAAGTPEFAAFVDRGVRLPSNPQRKIYISRSRFPKNGRFLFEDRIEQYLAAEGYLIFHPQEHSMSEQIEAYRTASHVVASDCSAMFLAGFAVPRGCQVGIINRRLIGATYSLEQMFRLLAGCEVFPFRQIVRQWCQVGAEDNPLKDLSLLDMTALSEGLRSAGFISGTDWPQPSDTEIKDEVSFWSRDFGKQFREKDLARAER